MTLLVSREEGGHHAEYLSLFSELLARAGHRARLVRWGWRHLLSSETLLFMMVEEAPFEFFLISLFRGLAGLRTAAILFKPIECLAPRALRWRVKRWALMLLRRLRQVAVMVIIPLNAEPRLSVIARYAIYDPQLWDLAILGRDGAGDPALAGQITTRANGRTILVAMGMQAQDKGFGYFSRLLTSCPALCERFLFVSAGKVAADSQDCAATFVAAGGLLIDRVMTEAEMAALYHGANMIWCCYAPWRDMASGIFGRAVQYGTPAVVRAGSYLEKIAAELGHPVIAVPWGDLAGTELLLSGSLPPLSPPELRQVMISRLQAQSIATIHSALKLV